MSKRRIIVPNPKIEKNDIGKKDKKFNDIYTNNIETTNISTDNINTEKINGEIIDEERYLENQFTIIYPGGGDAENPGVIKNNSKYILENPFPGYYVNCDPEVFLYNEWGYIGWISWYNSSYCAVGLICHQVDNNKLVLVTGGTYIMGYTSLNNTLYGTTFLQNKSEVFTQAPCRIKIWKVGKIK